MQFAQRHVARGVQAQRVGGGNRAARAHRQRSAVEVERALRGDAAVVAHRDAAIGTQAGLRAAVDLRTRTQCDAGAVQRDAIARQLRIVGDVQCATGQHVERVAGLRARGDGQIAHRGQRQRATRDRFAHVRIRTGRSVQRAVLCQQALGVHAAAAGHVEVALRGQLADVQVQVAGEPHVAAGRAVELAGAAHLHRGIDAADGGVAAAADVALRTQVDVASIDGDHIQVRQQAAVTRFQVDGAAGEHAADGEVAIDLAQQGILARGRRQQPAADVHH
ncbi:MAG TPA: hypothetical protein VIG68_02125, partial [Lysobacter sp.]